MWQGSNCSLLTTGNTTKKAGLMLSPSLQALREALLALEPTGAEGFEGLLAVALTNICGRDFRLAKSGLQNGKDGETLSLSQHVSFEAKRYDGKINDNDVLTKITRLIGSSTPPDIWILGATTEVSTQLLEPLQSATRKFGISTIILDWPKASPVPPLAVIFATAHEATARFLKTHIDDEMIVEKAVEALSKFRQSEEFQARSLELIYELTTASIALKNARLANERWLDAIFCSKIRARGQLGQAIAPYAETALPTRERTKLVDQVQTGIQRLPSSSILTLIGGEGCGKSWLIAQSWKRLENRPLTVIVAATDLQASAAHSNNLDRFLVSHILQQTGEVEDEASVARWNRRLTSWKELERQSDENPRLVLCVDGLNQNPKLDWPRLLDGMASSMEQLGGLLVITTRQSYFEQMIESSVSANIQRIIVPEWTASELEEILASKALSRAQVSPQVFQKLRNPRLLSVAFELLDRTAIQDLQELSVDRLLFEYFRIGARNGEVEDTPAEFSMRLAKHAQTILDRVKRQEREDSHIFERSEGNFDGYSLSADLTAVAGEHYFQTLPGDQTLYTLSDHGLSLALGLAIIKKLQRAERNDRDVSEALEEIIEPIEALDKAAEAIFSSTMVASIEGNCTPEIKRSLILRFIRSQNISPEMYPAFVSIVRESIEASISALEETLSARNRHAANKDWLFMAIRDCRQDAKCWPIVSANLDKWLRSYSLNPKTAVMRSLPHDSVHEIEEETKRKTDLLKERLSNLSPDESLFLQNLMIENHGSDPSALQEEALLLLAGMPLRSFAKALVACSLSMALNPSHRSPYDEYQALVRYNLEDWRSAREAILSASEFLAAPTTSKTGKWALVNILRATATPEDACAEDALVEELTKDRESFQGFSRVERYCTTDPCDPASKQPDNISATAEQYAALSGDELSQHRSMNSEDHFVRDALPGRVRFAPSAAVAAQRKFLDSVARRSPDILEFALASQESHSAAFNREIAQKLLELANEVSAPYDGADRKNRQRWIAAQYAIQIAFPHLTGDEQLAFIMAMPPHGPPLLKLQDVLKPASALKIENALEEAVNSNCKHKKLMITAFVGQYGIQLSEKGVIHLRALSKESSSSVRTQSMRTLNRLSDQSYLESLVAQEWSAENFDPKEDYFEIWYGSLSLISAAKRGLIDSEQVLDRISPTLFGVSVLALGSAIYSALEARLTRAFERALAVDLPFVPPQVEQKLERLGTPPLLSLADPDETLGPDAFFRRMNESPEEFEQRQRRNWTHFDAFEASLTEQKARLIIEDSGQGAIDAITAHSADHCRTLANQIVFLENRKLPQAHNFGLMLARSISQYDAELAQKLFSKLERSRPFVSIVSGPSKVSLDAICVWESADTDIIEDLRVKRLDQARTDYHLSQEVLAALLAGKQGVLERYIQRNLASPQPAVICRGLMVAGFGLESDFSDNALSQYEMTDCFIGRAAKAARFAYDRNIWARYWYEMMARTDRPEEFWRSSILFLKIVDARFSVWEREVPRSGEAIERFGPSIEDKISHRVGLWKSKREKTLCGNKTPNMIFTVVE